MRLTVVPSDKIIIKDGKEYKVTDLSYLDSNIHAIQWYDDKGEIEYVDGTSNLEITDMAIGLDLTKRSVQDNLKEQKLPWAQAKSFRGAAVLGDWVPFDARAEYSLAVNGNEMQFGSLKEMSWTPNELLEKLAEWAPLQSGDILFTGTPAGVGPLTPNDVVTASLYIDKQLVLSHRAQCV